MDDPFFYHDPHSEQHPLVIHLWAHSGWLLRGVQVYTVILLVGRYFQKRHFPLHSSKATKQIVESCRKCSQENCVRYRHFVAQEMLGTFHLFPGFKFENHLCCSHVTSKYKDLHIRSRKKIFSHLIIQTVLFQFSGCRFKVFPALFVF